MDFLSKLSLLYMLFPIISCHSSASESPTTIGQALGGSSYNSLLSPSNDKFFAFAPYTRSMMFFDSKTAQIEFSDKLDDNFKESFWLPSQDQRYAFVIEGRYVRIKSPISAAAKDVFRLGETIFSHAAAPSEGLFAFVDMNFSISLLQLDASGQPLQQWVGGPLLASGQRITVGDMLPGGRLLLGLDSKEMILVDCLASIEAKSWVYQTLPALPEQISWIAPVKGQANRALIQTSNSFLLYDLESSSAVSTLNLEMFHTAVMTSKGGLAHLGYKDINKGTMTLVYPNGDELRTLSLPNNLGEPLSSYLTEEYLLAHNSSEKAVRIRLSDALVESTLEVSKNARVGLSETAVLAVYQSPLGYAEIHRFDSDEPIVLKGFNLNRLPD